MVESANECEGRCKQFLPFRFIIASSGTESAQRSQQAIFFAALIGFQIYFSGHLPCKFFYSNYFSEGEGGGELGLYVFHHNNNFNLINIYSAKTITIEY